MGIGQAAEIDANGEEIKFQYHTHLPHLFSRSVVSDSRQEYWSGLPFPSPGDLPNPGIEPRSPTLQADSLSSEPPCGKNLKTKNEVMQPSLPVPPSYPELAVVIRPAEGNQGHTGGSGTIRILQGLPHQGNAWKWCSS